MKKLITPLIFSIVIITILASSCHKSDSTSNCGCNSKTIQTVNEWKGYLFFDSIQNKYEIQIGVPGLFSDYFICDSTISQLHSIIDTNRMFRYYVLFSGDVKTFCVPDTIAGYIDNMNNIKLTGITKIN